MAEVVKVGTPVRIVKSHEPWNEYELEDGTVIKVRLNALNFRRQDAYNPDGSPVYTSDLMPLQSAEVPASLKRKSIVDV